MNIPKLSQLTLGSPLFLVSFLREVDVLVQKYKLAPQIVVHAIAVHGPERTDVERYLDERAPRLN